jgi:fructosamine-3-kinase
MEDLAPGKKNSSYWIDFGKQLAALHMHTCDRYGFMHDNYIGSTLQPNAWHEDGIEFFAEQRLRYQAKLAHRRGFLALNEMHKLEKIALHLRELIPPQPASLIHGDLWSGNITSDRYGNPAIIDPAVYYGWAEADLAMMTLFGSYPKEFIISYQEVRELDAGFQERYPIYNLYHLLNHVNSFGDIYVDQVNSILKKYELKC